MASEDLSVIDAEAYAALPPLSERAPEAALHFVVVLWGKAFTDLFVDYCLPSLLAPGNLPSLSDPDNAVFHILTTAEDRKTIETAPVFQAISDLITVNFLIFPPVGPQDDKYRRMSQGHKQASALIAAAGAYGVYLCPDAVLSDGAIVALQKLAAAGSKVVLVPALRFEAEALTKALSRERGHGAPDSPLSLSGRRLMHLALPHLHPETIRYDWESQHYSFEPVCTFWKVPESDGIIMHSMSWGPLLFDYRGLSRHDTSALDNWTMDGDYVFANYGLGPHIAVITDSDILNYVSFTPRDERPAPLVRNPGKRASLRVMAFSAIMDPLKRALFRLPVRWHGGDLTPNWYRREETIAAFLETELKPSTWLERKWVQIGAGGLAGLPGHIAGFVRTRFRRLGGGGA